MSKRATSTSRLISRCVGAPIRVLRRVRNYYVRNLMQQRGLGAFSCEEQLSYNFSRVSAGDDDLSQLIRAASLVGQYRSVGTGVAERSKSVVVGRIDEDAPCCEFAEDVKVGSNLLFPAGASFGGTVRGRRICVLA